MGETYVGHIPQADIVNQVAHTAKMQGYAPDDLTTFSPEKWDTLFAHSIGSMYGSTRVGVILRLMALKGEQSLMALKEEQSAGG